jgi:membrane associated rhomboid family serine protease
MLYPIMPAGFHNWLAEQNALDEYQKFHPYQIFTHLFSHSPTMFAHILVQHVCTMDVWKGVGKCVGAKTLFTFLPGQWRRSGRATFSYAIFQVRTGMAKHSGRAVKFLPEKIFGAIAPALGASGAIMGLFAAFAYLFPNTELIFLFIPFPIKAKWMVLIMVGLDLFGGFSKTSGDNVAHFAHLGGAITGFIIVFIWNKTNRKTLY